MRIGRWTAALVIVAMVAGVARADTITLQNGLAGYTGCEDTALGDAYVNHGIADWFGNVWYDRLRAHLGLSEKRFKTLVRFNDLDTAIPAGSTITSARLYLYKYAIGGGSGDFSNVAAYRSLRMWDEGQGGLGHVDQNWTTDSLSGANLYYANAARQLGKGTQPDAGTYPNVWANNVPAGITIDHAQHGSGYEATMFVEEFSIAAVNANENSWYHDTTNNILYFRDGHAGVFNSTGMSYYTSDDLWDDTAGTGSGDIAIGSPLSGDWPDGGAVGWGYIDVTAWAQDWYTTPANNYGVLITPNDNDIRWYQSEYSDPTAGLTFGPKLEIEYEAGAGAIPEPAGLGLVGMALLGLRRKKRRSSTLLRRPAMRQKLLVVLLAAGLAVGFAGAANAAPWELPDETVLAVDFGPTEPPTDTTETGWVSFQAGADNAWTNNVTYTHTYAPYTVSVSATVPDSPTLQLRARRESSPTDSGDFTWGNVYNDSVFTYNTMMIKIEGLEANHTYEKLYLLNGGGAAGRISKMWLTLGTPVTPVLHTLGAAPTANNDPGSIMELADPTTNALGELEISFTTNPGSPGGVSSWTNGFILVDYPQDVPVPEPAGLGLVGLAALALNRRRR